MLFSPLQTQYQSSVYSTVHHRHTFQSSVYSTIHYRLTTGSPYTQQSTTDPVPSLRILYNPLQFQSFVHSMIIYRLRTGPPYTLQSLTVHVSVLRILYNPLQSQFLSSVYSIIIYTQYRFSVYSTAHCSPSSSPPHTLQSTRDTVTVLHILYKSTTE